MAGGNSERDIRDAFKAIALNDGTRPKQNYAFWGTQPVAQFNEEATSSEVRRTRRCGRRSLMAGAPPPCAAPPHRRRSCPAALAQASEGPIDQLKTVDQVRQEPYPLPSR